MAYLGGAGARRRPRWAPPGRQGAGFSAGCRFGGLAGSARFGQANNNVNEALGRPPKLPGAWCPPPLPLWWLMCSTRVGPMPFGAAWWVGPCARTALLGGGAVPPQGRPLRGRGPAWGFLCHPGGLCRGPWNFCGRRGLVAQETAPLGHQGAPAKRPFCQAWGVGCQCTRCVATAGVGTPWSTASATQVAYLGAALRPGGGLWAPAPVPATAGAGWAAAWVRWGLGG